MYLPYIDKKVRSFARYLKRYLELQLFITLCAWPILAAWGLPLSPAGIVGNLLFSPLLLAFLFCASLIFIGEVLSIPYRPLCTILELLTGIWTWLLSLSRRYWLFTLAHPPQIVATLLPLITLLIMCRNPPYTRNRRIALFVGLYVCAGVAVPYLYAHKNKVLKIPFCQESLTCIRSSSKTCILDRGQFGRHPSSVKAVERELVSFLVRQGIRSITDLIISRPSLRVFRTTARLLKLFPVDCVYLPVWTGTLSNKGWRAWQEVLYNARTYGTQIQYIAHSQNIICGSYSLSICISPTPMKKNRFVYRALACSSIVDSLKKS